MDKKYDDIKNGLGEIIFAADNSNGGAAVSRTLCERTLSVDAGGDFELPTHFPEISKLIKVNVRPSAPTRFISGSGVQINGGIDYSAIFLGSDGEIYCASFPDEYSVSAPFEGDSGALADKIEVSAKVCPDNVTCRVSGAARISIRCRLSVKVLALTEDKRDFGLRSENGGRYLKLIKKVPSCKGLFGVKDDMVLTSSVDTSKDGTRYLYSDCKVLVTDTAAGDGYVDCRGYAAIRHLMTYKGEIYSVSDKISFSETVELDGACSSASVSVAGLCTEAIPVTCDFGAESDGKTEISVKLCLTAAALVPCEREYVKDMYSSERECTLELAGATLPTLVACKNGNMTFGGREELSKLGISSEVMNIFDVSGVARVESVEKDGDAFVAKGKARFSFVYSGAETGEYTLAECELPFRYEFEGNGDGVSRFDAAVSVVEPRARVEGERISFDCELAFSICAFGDSEICSVVAVKGEGAERKERKGITICYPDASESLWSIAKRYGAPFEDVARENGLDRTADADEISMPAGARFMII